MIRIDPTHSVPIWKQIEDGIRRLVATGVLPGGEPVPSVRDLARELRVNPATVSKAYQRLTDAAILAVRRGEGTYVCGEPTTMRRKERKQELRVEAERFAVAALSLGLTEDEAQNEVRMAMRRLGNGEKA